MNPTYIFGPLTLSLDKICSNLISYYKKIPFDIKTPDGVIYRANSAELMLNFYSSDLLTIKGMLQQNGVEQIKLGADDNFI